MRVHFPPCVSGLLLCTLIPTAAVTAQFPVSGRVLDTSSRPLSGVAVTDLGTNRTLSTTASGGFSLSAAAGEVHLRFRKPGYAPMFRRFPVRPGASDLARSDIVLTAIPAATTVGVSGGTVLAPSGERLVVPAGALGKNTPISFVRVAGAAPTTTSSEKRVALRCFAFEPSGLVFRVPARLEFTVAGHADGILSQQAAKPLQAIEIDTSSGRRIGTAEQVSVEPRSGVASVAVPHFSTVVIYDDFGPFDFWAHFILIHHRDASKDFCLDLTCADLPPHKGPEVTVAESQLVSVTKGVAANWGIQGSVGKKDIAEIGAEFGLSISTSVTEAVSTTVATKFGSYEIGTGRYEGCIGTRLHWKEVVLEQYELPWNGSPSLVSSVVFRYDYRASRNNPTPCSNPKRVADVRPGSGSSSYGRMLPHDGRIYFDGDDGTRGRELWSTDGTASGTHLVADVAPGPDHAGPSGLVRIGNRFLFAARSVLGVELWKSDGTASGTSLVVDLIPGPGSSSPNNLFSWKGRAWFAANDGVHGFELWRSDGTAAGTVMVADIRHGSSSALPRSFAGLPDGRVVFRATTDAHGAELWISDGSASGTRLLSDIRRGSSSSVPSFMVEWQERVVFAASDDVHGRELWITDGTPAGTRLLVDLVPGSVSGSPGYIVAMGDRLLFRAHDASFGYELWTTDGSVFGTKLVADIRPGPSSSSPTHLTPVGSQRVFFSATDSAHGRELWVTDGTTIGTRLVADVRPGPVSSTPTGVVDGARPQFAVLDKRVWFTAYEELGGRELWVYDAGAAATRFGESCGEPPATLDATDPVLGRPMRVQGSAPTGARIGVTLLGRRGTEVRLGECISYLNLGRAWPIHVSVTPRFTFSLPIPNDASFARLRLSMQTWFLDGSAVWLSNGVSLAFGRHP